MVTMLLMITCILGQLDMKVAPNAQIACRFGLSPIGIDADELAEDLANA
jgi:hypothetical protein